MRVLTLLVSLLLTGPTLASATPHITSVYTKINWERCKTREEGEGAYSLRRCPGYAGIPLFVDDMDDRSYLSAGSSGSSICLGDCRFSDLHDTVEWRRKDGKPFSIIYRLHLQWTGESGNTEESSSLVVGTIGSEEHPGCAIAEIPEGKPNANALARAAADRILTGKVECLKQ